MNEERIKTNKKRKSHSWTIDVYEVTLCFMCIFKEEKKLKKIVVKRWNFARKKSKTQAIYFGRKKRNREWSKTLQRRRRVTSWIYERKKALNIAKEEKSFHDSHQNFKNFIVFHFLTFGTFGGLNYARKNPQKQWCIHKTHLHNEKKNKKKMFEWEKNCIIEIIKWELEKFQKSLICLSG